MAFSCSLHIVSSKSLWSSSEDSNHETQQQDEVRILKLVGVSVEHGLRAVWIASLAIVVIYVSIGFSLSLYRYLHTVAKLF